MFSIMDLIGKNPWAIEKLVGEEDKSAFVKAESSAVYVKTYYRGGGIEITYIANVADHIIIYKKETKLIKEFIRFLGLRFTPANVKNVGVVNYYQIAGLTEVAFYGDKEGNIDKIHIKAYTP